MTPTKTFGLFTSICRRPLTPSTEAPLKSVPEASIGSPWSLVRHWPTPSKFSRENPMGSIDLWQPAHTGFARCASMLSRNDRGLPSADSSFNGGTLGGGGDGGTPSRFVRIHLPRSTGDVRLGYDVTVKMLACPSSPRRASSGTLTRRNWLP